MNKLGDVHDLDANLVPPHMGGHGPNTLLTGRDDRLSACRQNLFDFSFGYFCRKLGIDHLQVAAAAAALAILTIARQFHQPDTRDRSDQVSGFIKDPGSSSQITGVMIGDR